VGAISELVGWTVEIKDLNLSSCLFYKPVSQPSINFCRCMPSMIVQGFLSIQERCFYGRYNEHIWLHTQFDNLA
jgi:hypothetical protein